MTLNFNVKSTEEYEKLFSQLKASPSMRKAYLADTNTTDLSSATAKYRLSHYELYKLREDVVKFNAVNVSCHTKLVATPRGEDRISPVMYDMEGVQSFMSQGYELEKERNLTRMDIHRSLLRSICSTLEIKNEQTVPAFSNQQVGTNLKMDESSIRQLGAAFTGARIDNEDKMPKALHDALNNKDESSATALSIVETIPPPIAKISHATTQRGTVVLKPAKVGVRIPEKYKTNFIESVLMKVSGRSKFAEVCNNHVYGKDFGGLNPYLDLVIDIESMFDKGKLDGRNIIIHHRAHHYALLVSRRFKDSKVYFLGPIKRTFEQGRLTSVNSVQINKIPGLHLILDFDSVSCESGGDIWATGAEADKDKREKYDSIVAKRKDFAVMRRVSIFSIVEGGYYVPSVRMRDKFVWQNHSSEGLSRDEMLRCACQFLLNWYLYPWTGYIAAHECQWVPLLKGEYSLKLNKKEADRFNFEINEKETIDRFLRANIEDGDDDEEELKDRLPKRKKEIKEVDEEEEFLDDGDDDDEAAW